MSTDTDARIAEKLRNIRSRAEAEIEALGGSVQNDAPQPDQRDDNSAAGVTGASAAGGGGGMLPPPPSLGGGNGGDNPPMGGDGRILGNTHNAGADTESTQIARGEVRRVDDPVLAGVQSEYLTRLQRGDSAESIIRWARDVGISPTAFGGIQAQVRYRQEHPETPIDEYDVSQLDDTFVQQSIASRAAGYLSGTPVGAYVLNAADAASAFNLDSIVGVTGGNAEQARIAIDQSARENPVASTLGTLSGGIMTSLAGEAGIGALVGRGALPASMGAAIPRALAADSLYGAAAGAGSADYNEDGTPANAATRLQGAGLGAVAGLAGSYAGQRVGNALTAAARGGASAPARAMLNEGVPLTAGQAAAGGGRVGALVKSLEDRLSGIWGVGDMVNARRGEGMRAFNSRAFDRALEPIGGSVGERVGADAIESAQQQVGQAFTDALAGKGAVPDEAFARDLEVAVRGVRAVDSPDLKLVDDLAEVFAAHADEPMLSGEALQMIHRELRDIRLSYRQHPRFRRIAPQIERVERAVFDLFDRQASGTVEDYRKARQAYRRLATLEDAVLKAQNQSDQVFTPAQLGRADKQATRRLEGRGTAARGGSPFNDLTTAAQEVLPNKVPDSGTMGRALVPLALVGSGGAADAASGGSGTGLTIGAILAGLYTRTGQRILTKPARGMKPGTARRAALESPKLRRGLGLTGGAAAGALTNSR